MTTILLVAAAVAFAWPWLKAHAHDIKLPKLDARQLAGLALLAAALWSAMSRSPAEPTPAPAPTGAFTLKGKFSGPDAAADAATTAALMEELASELEWDAMQPQPLLKTGVAFDELRIRARLLLCRGESLGEKHPRARDAIKEFLDARAGTSGGPLTPEQRAAWIAAYREVGRAAADAAR